MESTENDILADKPVLIHPDPHTLKHSHTQTNTYTQTYMHTHRHTGNLSNHLNSVSTGNVKLGITH